MRRFRLGMSLLWLGMVLCALGGLHGFWRWHREEQSLGGQGRPVVVFVLDSSCSMLASSGESSRLEVGKSLIRELVQGLPGLEYGLVSFSGEAMVDYPPSVDESGFLTALDAVVPAFGVSPGSSPESGLVLGEGLCSGRSGVMVLVTDGEEEVESPGGGGWADRSVPLGWCVVGSGAPMPIPLGGSWLRDPETGEIAMSQADEERVREWAGLSAAPQVQLSPGDRGADQVALVKGLLSSLSPADRPGRGFGSDQDWLSGLLGLLGAVFLMSGLWLTCRRVHLCLVLLFALGGRLVGEEVSPEVRLAEVRLALSSPGLSMSERGRLLCNGGGLCWQLGRQEGRDVEERLRLVCEGVSWCREAIRCGAGRGALVNVGLLLGLASRLEAERVAALQPSGPSGSGEASASSEMSSESSPKTSGESVDVDDVLGMAGGVSPAPTLVGDGPPQASERSASEGGSGAGGGAGSWRSVLEKRRPMGGLKRGVKPW